VEKIIVFDEKFVVEFKAGWQWRLRCEHRESITEFDAGMWGSMIEFITVDIWPSHSRMGRR
jgi:hypothetical protein